LTISSAKVLTPFVDLLDKVLAQMMFGMTLTFCCILYI